MVEIQTLDINEHEGISKRNDSSFNNVLEYVKT